MACLKLRVFRLLLLGTVPDAVVTLHRSWRHFLTSCNCPRPPPFPSNRSASSRRHRVPGVVRLPFHCSCPLSFLKSATACPSLPTAAPAAAGHRVPGVVSLPGGPRPVPDGARLPLHAHGHQQPAVGAAAGVHPQRGARGRCAAAAVSQPPVIAPVRRVYQAARSNLCACPDPPPPPSPPPLQPASCPAC